MLVLAPDAFRVELTEAEKKVYRFPYATPDDRLALADALSQFFDPAQIKIMQAYIAWMQGQNCRCCTPIRCQAM
jgi:hypothetical protein